MRLNEVFIEVTIRLEHEREPGKRPRGMENRRKTFKLSDFGTTDAMMDAVADLLEAEAS